MLFGADPSFLSGLQGASTESKFGLNSLKSDADDERDGQEHQSKLNEGRAFGALVGKRFDPSSAIYQAAQFELSLPPVSSEPFDLFAVRDTSTRSTSAREEKAALIHHDHSPHTHSEEMEMVLQLQRQEQNWNDTEAEKVEIDINKNINKKKEKNKDDIQSKPSSYRRPYLTELCGKRLQRLKDLNNNHNLNEHRHRHKHRHINRHINVSIHELVDMSILAMQGIESDCYLPHQLPQHCR